MYNAPEKSSGDDKADQRSYLKDRDGYRDWRAKINMAILSKCGGHLLISTSDGSTAPLIAAYTGLSQAKKANWTELQATLIGVAGTRITDTTLLRKWTDKYLEAIVVAATAPYKLALCLKALELECCGDGNETAKQIANGDLDLALRLFHPDWNAEEGGFIKFADRTADAKDECVLLGMELGDLKTRFFAAFRDSACENWAKKREI